MEISYINPEEFNKQLAENNLSLEALAELLEIEINTAKKIFLGHKAISNFRILKLHELAGFNYSRLITKNKTKVITPIKPTKKNRSIKKKSLPVSKLEKITCEKCNFLINKPKNYCPNCGTRLPK